MLRNILGFAVLALVAWLVLRIFFGLLGTLIGLAITVVWLAVLGFGVYLILRLVAPATADKVRDTIKGRPAKAA